MFQITKITEMFFFSYKKISKPYMCTLKLEEKKLEKKLNVNLQFAIRLCLKIRVLSNRVNIRIVQYFETGVDEIKAKAIVFIVIHIMLVLRFALTLISMEGTCNIVFA